MQVSTIGLDIAKNVFQVHGVDVEGRPVHRALSGWHGGLRDGASLGTPTDGAGPRGQANAAGVREGLCQAEQERCR